MICDRPDIAEKLVPYVEGALGEPDRTEVASHLRRCVPCQDDARQVKESILTLKAAVRTGVWKESREHTSSEWLAMHFEDERAREAGFLPSSGLTDEQARQVRVHLAECQECREELGMLRELAAEAIVEAVQTHQPLPRALRLEIERLYPTQSQTERPVSERTLGLADRLMAWINPKSLVMASLCIVALTFSYSLTRGTDSPELAKNPTASSSEVAMLDREADQAAPPSLESTVAQSQKKEKDENARPKASPPRAEKAKPDSSPPARDEKLAVPGGKPGERGVARESTSTRPDQKSAQPVRTASTAAAPRPAPTVAATAKPTAVKPDQNLVAVKPATQNQAQRPVAVAVKPAAEPAGEPAPTPTSSPMVAMSGQEAASANGTLAKDEGKSQGAATAEPVVVAAGPVTGPVPNAVTDLREESQVATQSEGAKTAALPPAAGAPATGGRVSVPAASTASAPVATRTNSVPASRRVTGVVKPPAPATVPVRSLPDDKAAGYSVASTAPTQSIQKTPADVARKQSMSRSVDGLASEQVALSRQATLGPKARSVARQVSANASVLVEERPDGSVTVTVRPDRPLNAEEKDKLRRLLRSELNLGEADTISIRQ